MRAEALYARLPVVAQNAAATLYSWHLRRRRFNNEFQRLLADYRARELMPPEHIHAFRDDRIQRFVAHAVATVPYYGALFRRLGLTATDIRSLADLQQLPVLGKTEVQDATTQLTSTAAVGPRLVCHTSGSTGAGLRFPATWQAQREQYAAWWRYRLAHGLTPTTPCLYLGGRTVVPLRQQRPPFWRYDRAGGQVLFSAYHLNLRTAPAYLAEMRRVGAPWLHGYPSMVALLAKYALQHSRRLPLRWVTLAAENVLSWQKEVIGDAFGVQPTNHYGMAEAVANISECPLGRLHVDEDFAAVEFQPIGDQQYRILGTNLSNPAFPLLRYDTGDIATVTNATCSCGRPGRVVDRLDGRQEDYVLTHSGSRLGRLDHIFKDLVNIREAQIRQAERGHMTLVVVRGPAYSAADEQRLRAETLARVGTQLDFDIEYTQALPRTASGKLRFVVSTVAPPPRDPTPPSRACRASI